MLLIEVAEEKLPPPYSKVLFLVHKNFADLRIMDFNMVQFVQNTLMFTDNVLTMIFMVHKCVFIKFYPISIKNSPYSLSNIKCQLKLLHLISVQSTTMYLSNTLHFYKEYKSFQ